MPDGPRYSKEEFARRGDEIYDRVVAPRVGAADRGKFVAIDIETEAFAVDIDPSAATKRLRAGRPDAQLWLTRAGSRYFCRIGRPIAGSPK